MSLACPQDPAKFSMSEYTFYGPNNFPNECYRRGNCQHIIFISARAANDPQNRLSSDGLLSKLIICSYILPLRRSLFQIDITFIPTNKTALFFQPRATLNEGEGPTAFCGTQ